MKGEINMVKICIIVSIIALIFYIVVSVIEARMIKQGKIKKVEVKKNDCRTISTTNRNDKFSK